MFCTIYLLAYKGSHGIGAGVEREMLSQLGDAAEPFGDCGRASWGLSKMGGGPEGQGLSGKGEARLRESEIERKGGRP